MAITIDGEWYRHPGNEPLENAVAENLPHPDFKTRQDSYDAFMLDLCP